MPPPVISPAKSETTAVTTRLSDKEADVVYDPSMPPLLADQETVLERFLTLLTEDIHRERLPVAKIEIRGTNDPEEDTRQILVRLWLNGLSGQEIRDYYREFSRRVDDLVHHFNEEQRQFFMAKISFQARRVADA